MKHFFVDTNIAIDFLTDRKPFSSEAAKLFDKAEKNSIKLYMASVSFTNIYYIIKKLSTHKQAISILKELEKITDIIDTGKIAVKNALESDFKDFEDAVQYHTATTNQKVSAIITRNITDFKLSKLAVISPAEALIISS